MVPARFTGAGTVRGHGPLSARRFGFAFGFATGAGAATSGVLANAEPVATAAKEAASEASKRLRSIPESFCGDAPF
jgi:hypothetical protein